ncbi:hypothetical protein DFAR_450002 [Desulfarculales bacterium]
MLEKIKVTSGEFVEVVSLAQPATLRTGVLGSPVDGNLQKDLVGLFIGVRTLSHQPPGRLHSPGPRTRSSPASMIASCFNSVMRIAAS